MKSAIDKQIAMECVQTEINALQKLPYAELTRLVKDVQSKSVQGSDGKQYNLEVMAVWDESKVGGI